MVEVVYIGSERNGVTFHVGLSHAAVLCRDIWCGTSDISIMF